MPANADSSRRHDDSLRDGLPMNLLHTQPSYAMRADAAQFLVTRRWTDVASRACLRLSFVKPCGGERKVRTAPAEYAGLYPATSGAPGGDRYDFTQKLGAFDMLLVADEIHGYG
jgi:hypothetical protein